MSEQAAAKATAAPGLPSAALKPAQLAFLQSDAGCDASQLRSKLSEAWQGANGLEQALGTLLRQHEAQRNDLEQQRRMRTGLEGLCRELRAQNAKVVEASSALEAATAARAQEAATRFQSALDEVSAKIEASSEAERRRLLLEQALAAAEQRLALTQEHAAKQLEAKELELKLAAARAAAAAEQTAQRLALGEEHRRLAEQLAKDNDRLTAAVKSYADQFSGLGDVMKRTDALTRAAKEDLTLAAKRREELERHVAALERDKAAVEQRLAKLSAKAKEDHKAASTLAAKQAAQLDSLKALCHKLKRRLDEATASSAGAPPAGLEEALAQVSVAAEAEPDPVS